MVLIGLMFLGVSAFAEVTIDEILVEYRTVQLSLARDEYKEAVKAAEDLAKKGQDWVEAAGENPQVANVKNMVSGAKGVAEATDEKGMRLGFESVAVGTVEYLRKEEDLRKKYQLYYCPMAPGYRFWVQIKSDTKLMNPYFGTEMQQCGVKKNW